MYKKINSENQKNIKKMELIFSSSFFGFIEEKKIATRDLITFLGEYVCVGYNMLPSPILL